MRKVIDCFPFYNELNLLDFRLKYMDDVVDKFVLVEATHTQAGNPKELYFEKNKERYAKYLHKIEHVIVDDCPNTNDPWDNENHQRRCINKGIVKTNPEDDDIIIISDVDEIVKRSIVDYMKKSSNKLKFTSLVQDFYWFNIWTKDKAPWFEGSRLLSYEMFRDDMNSDAQTVRYTFPSQLTVKHPKFKIVQDSDIIPRGGWHFSSFGDANFVRNKMLNCAHQEYNLPQYTNIENVRESIKYGKDLAHRPNINFIKINPKHNTDLPEFWEMLDKDFVYVILRSVQKPEHEVFWWISYNCIRRNDKSRKIIVIDDNSSIEVETRPTVNCEFIKSEFPGRGELLPYYYFHKYKWANKMVFFHDSMFMHHSNRIEKYTDSIEDYRFLWSFFVREELNPPIDSLIEGCKNADKLQKIYEDTSLWQPAFGVTSIISWNFLNKMQETFSFMKPLLNNIRSRKERIQLECIFACLCVGTTNTYYPALYGDIHNYSNIVLNSIRSNKITCNEYNESNLPVLSRFDLVKIYADR
jgi:beta-1,4-mannosyl-glycoprotein beta-1,4-N-acetylglucosaminyltransferase